MSSSSWPLCLPTRLAVGDDPGCLPKGVRQVKRILLALIALGVLLAAAPAAAPVALLAAHSTNGGGKGHVQSTNSSLSLVLLNSTDGVPHWGQQVTFAVSTTATTEPNVSLMCYQHGV